MITYAEYQAALAKLSPDIREGFAKSIDDITSQAQLNAVIRHLEAGNIDAALMALALGPGFFAPLDDAMQRAFIAGGASTIDIMRKRAASSGAGPLMIGFQPRARGAIAWLDANAGKLITDLTEGQRDAARHVIAQGIQSGKSPRDIALDLVGRKPRGATRRMGGVIGLSERELGFVESYRERLLKQGKTSLDAAMATRRYADKLLRRRGERIARSEATAAFNAGRLEAMNQVIENGVPVQVITKTWHNVKDSRSRDTHRAMSGQTVPHGKPFQSPSGAFLMHPGDTTLGAGGSETVACRCWMTINVDFTALAQV